MVPLEREYCPSISPILNGRLLMTAQLKVFCVDSYGSNTKITNFNVACTSVILLK